MKNEFKVKTAASLTAVTDWDSKDRSTIYAGDIRHPWKSVYGFPTAAAQLAADQELILHCRNDEIDGFLTQLNNLLKQPESLNQAYARLKQLGEATHRKLVRLIKLEQQPISDSDISELIDSIEEMLADSSEQTVAGRLQNTLSPDQPAAEIAGLRIMLARQRVLLHTLAKVKDRGFQVAIRDRRRQPQRPGLKVNSKAPLEQKRQNGAANGLAAGSRPQTGCHLTLWGYLIARNGGR